MRKAERHQQIRTRATSLAASGEHLDFRGIETQLRFVEGYGDEARQVLDDRFIRAQITEAIERANRT